MDIKLFKNFKIIDFQVISEMGSIVTVDKHLTNIE